MESSVALAFLAGLAVGGGLAAVALHLIGTLRLRQATLTDLVTPLKETLERMGEKVEEAERERSEAYGALAQQLRHVAEGQARLESETDRLVRALRSPTVRGRWGEMQLRRVVEIAGGQLEMVSLGWANPTPWHSPRECSDEELGEKIRAMLPGLTGAKPVLFNLHVPPHGSGLDWAPLLTEDLRPVQAGGEVQMVPVGSKAVDAVLRERQPLLGLHGHIHESRGAARIGSTLSLNPGSRYGEGVLDGVLVTISRGKVKSYQLVSG